MIPQEEFNKRMKEHAEMTEHYFKSKKEEQLSKKEQTIFKAPKKKNFTMINNEILYDGRLSFRATGLLAYLLSLPETWTIHKYYLDKTKTEGRGATLKAFQELIDTGYVIQIESIKRGEGGKFKSKGFQYLVYEVSIYSSQFESIYGKINYKEIK